MATKRVHSPELVPNPFIKKRNLEWSINLTDSARNAEDNTSHGPDSDVDAVRLGPVSASPPPPLPKPAAGPQPSPRSAEVEAGRVQISDHPTYFRELLGRQTLDPYPAGQPHLTAAAQAALYAANVGSAQGAHFVVHQHDHPVAGTHYDLRLQIGASSSASWALPYGPPGDANSARPNRYAVETRVHALWNHLVEAASAATGSLLVWDTGTYEVLPPPPPPPPSSSSQGTTEAPPAGPTEQEKLHAAFAARRVRLRLRGARLPHDYVVRLLLTRAEDLAVRARTQRPGRGRRRRLITAAAAAAAAEPMTSSDSEPEPEPEPEPHPEPEPAAGGGGEEGGPAGGRGDAESLSAMERELRELKDEEVRRTNAYPGATNSIGSVHQRKWFLSLDKEACGFVRRRVSGQVVWEKETAPDDGDVGGEDADHDNGRLTFPFYVRGPEVERSVVTGRRAEDVLRDEGVVGFVRRRGWQPILN